MRRLTILFVSAVALLLSASLGAVPASAAERQFGGRLTWDFDGDHHSDLALGSTRDSTFTVRVWFSGRLTKTVLKTRINDRVTPTIFALDIDRDDDVDIVLAGPSSRPLRVWFNEGNGRFDENSDWFFQPLHHRGSNQVGAAPQVETDIPCGAVNLPHLFLPTIFILGSDAPGADECFPPPLVPRQSASSGTRFTRGPPSIS